MACFVLGGLSLELGGEGIAPPMLSSTRANGRKRESVICPVQWRHIAGAAIAAVALELAPTRSWALEENASILACGLPQVELVITKPALRQDQKERVEEASESDSNITVARLSEIWRYCSLLSGGVMSTTALTILVLYIVQDRFVYWPSSVSKGTPARFGVPYEDVRLIASDGTELNGWLLKQEKNLTSAPTVVYFHGTDKNASFRLRKVTALYHAVGCNVFLISYRGYGNSKGRPTETGLCMDAESSMRFIQSRTDIDQSQLWCYGESLGGAVAVWFSQQYQHRLQGLCLENTFTSLLDMVKVVHPILDPLKALSRNKWPTSSRITKLRIPVLFLSGDEDELVPPRMMRELFDTATEASFKRFVAFNGGTHNGTWRLNGFFEEVASFVEECTHPKSQGPLSQAESNSSLTISNPTPTHPAAPYPQ